MQKPRRGEQQCSHQRAQHRADQPKRQRQKPDEGKQNQRQQCRGPAEHGEDAPRKSACVDLFELEAGVPRVAHPNPERFESLVLDMRRKIGEKLAEQFSGWKNHALSPEVELHLPQTPATPHPRALRARLERRRTFPTTDAPIPARRGAEKQPHPAPDREAWKLPRKRVREAESWNRNIFSVVRVQGWKSPNKNQSWFEPAPPSGVAPHPIGKRRGANMAPTRRTTATKEESGKANCSASPSSN